MTSRHYTSIVGLAIGIAGLAIAVVQPLHDPAIQWAAFYTGIAGFVFGMAAACTLPSVPPR